MSQRITGCGDLAEDAVQEAVVRLWQQRERPPADCASWLVHAVVHRSLHLRRTVRRRWAHEAKAARSVPTTLEPIDAAHRSEIEQLVRDEIEALPAPLRRTLRLHLEGRDYAAIAAALDLPIGTVRSRLHRARRELIDRLGGLAFDADCPLCEGGAW